MSTEPLRPSLVAKFRSDRKRLPLHPMEKAVLAALSVHLCFLPWALGTMHAWSQITSLGLAIVGFVVAMLPRHYTSEYTGGPSFHLSAWPKLLKFPLFWIGLALLAYIVVQGLNPSWVWERNETRWWLRRVNDIAWLPTSIDTPFERFNLWRKVIIYASTWLVACTLWVGVTRKRSLQVLLIVILVNACLLALAGFAQQALSPRMILGLMKAPVTSAPFATFIYHNHAGAYLALLLGCAVTLAVILNDQRVYKMRKSSPASIVAIGGLLLIGAIFMTLSRGAVLTAVLFFVVFGVWFWRRGVAQPGPGNNRIVTFLVIGLFAAITLFTARKLDFSSIEIKFAKLVKEQSREESTQGRILAHESASRMLADHWERGVGAGGFRYLFPQYIKKHPEVYQGGRMFWANAHNDWLEIPIELGAGGCLILLTGAGFVLVFLFRHRRAWPAPVAVLLLGAGQTLAHAWFDFPFQNPAILTTWLGLIVITMRWIELEEAAQGAKSA